MTSPSIQEVYTFVFTLVVVILRFSLSTDPLKPGFKIVCFEISEFFIPTEPSTNTISELKSSEPN